MLRQLPDIGGKIFMTKIADAFDHKKAFIGFLTAGDPTIEKTKDYIRQMQKAGAALIEIGIPFSDPIAEGPTIQNADVRALKNNVTSDDVFQMVDEIKDEIHIPLVYMTYLNVVYHYGYEEFFKKCQQVGIVGIIIPDLPYEEADEVKDIAAYYGVTLISMIAPTSADRVKMIASQAKGFIYLVSSMGVTGTRSNQAFASNLEEIVAHIRDVTDTPVAIGFGIHEPEQAKAMANIADGAIVGSGIVDLIAENGDHADQAVYDYVHAMASAINE